MIRFTKMQGSGNDFILIDARDGGLSGEARAAFARRFCPRALGIGADGVIWIEKDPEFDFRWDFYNADGSKAEMCGNGARCAAVFARRIGAAGERMRFRTLAGPIAASLTPAGARVQLTDATLPEEIRALPVAGRPLDLWFLNTGVPHAVAPVADLEAVDVRRDGAAIRRHERFAPRGTNANFIARDGKGIAIRTYERGVEDETLACGTGSVAAAIVAFRLWNLRPPVPVRTRGGIVLSIDFREESDRFAGVFLEGPAETVFEGTVDA